jgi:hypothetical protein
LSDAVTARFMLASGELTPLHPRARKADLPHDFERLVAKAGVRKGKLATLEHLVPFAD